MRQVRIGAALFIVVLIAVLTAANTLAAPPMQDATSTPTATRVRRPGPTWTPTPTMLPLPSGAGRIAVYAAAVRATPFLNSAALGSLPYNAEVHPLGRSLHGDWVAVEFEGQIGWLLAELVTWSPDFDFESLQILIPPFDETAVLAASTPTQAPPTETAQPSETLPPDATATPAPSETLAPSIAPSPSPEAAVIPPAATAISAPIDTTPRFTLPIGVILPWVGIGLAVALLGIYGWQFSKGQREVRRYAKTFPLANCPVCQFGTLSLDETVQRPLGIAHVTRTVRCDTCRSVLRQGDSGEWRYAIDPYINPQLAAEFDGKTFDDARLRDFVITAAAYPPNLHDPELEGLPPLTDEEILADLESRIPPIEEEVMPAEEETIESDISEAPEDGDLVESPPEDQPTE